MPYTKNPKKEQVMGLSPGFFKTILTLVLICIYFLVYVFFSGDTTNVLITALLLSGFWFAIAEMVVAFPKREENNTRYSSIIGIIAAVLFLTGIYYSYLWYFTGNIENTIALLIFGLSTISGMILLLISFLIIRIKAYKKNKSIVWIVLTAIAAILMVIPILTALLTVSAVFIWSLGAATDGNSSVSVDLCTPYLLAYAPNKTDANQQKLIDCYEQEYFDKATNASDVTICNEIASDFFTGICYANYYDGENEAVCDSLSGISKDYCYYGYVITLPIGLDKRNKIDDQLTCAKIVDQEIRNECLNLLTD
jgi:hypothetical protein